MTVTQQPGSVYPSLLTFVTGHGRPGDLVRRGGGVLEGKDSQNMINDGAATVEET